MKYTHLIAVLCFLLISNCTFAQQSYSPDRPGIGTGSFITPEDMFGLEAGIEFEHNLSGDQFNIGQVLFRYGVSSDFEFRIALNSYTIQERTLIGGSDRVIGVQDFGVGVKYNILRKSEGEGNLSLLGSLSIPTGSDEFSSGEFVPFVGVLGDVVLSDEMSLSSNFGYDFGYSSATDFVLLTVTPVFTLPKAAHSSFYFGYAGKYFGNNLNQTFIETGYTYTFDSGIQLDFNFGSEWEREIVFLGVGFARGF